MGKLGKKARKFAKKHLPSVLRQRRKIKAMMKRKYSSKGEQDVAEDQVGDGRELSSERIFEVEDIASTSLVAIFSEVDDDVVEDSSDGDGFLSEDSSCPYIPESANETCLEDNDIDSNLSTHNKKIHSKLVQHKKKLDKLKEKDPDFAKFLESYSKNLESYDSEETDSDEGETGNHEMQSVNEDGFNLSEVKILTNSCINYWCQLVMEQQSVAALTSLLNGYRAACRYGTKSTGCLGAVACQRIQYSEAFCNILMFMLREADNVFRGLLGISSSNGRKETIMEFKNTSKWKTLNPLVKSYLKSTLILLNQATDPDILTFCFTQLRSSAIFFAAFPSYLRRLIQVSVHLWATGGGTLSLCSFQIIRDVCSMFSFDCFNTCFIKMYKTFLAHCSYVEPSNMEHIQFLRDSFIKLCSVDVPQSISNALVSIQQLARIFQQGLRAKNKEALKNICSWQYINCINLWVMFISMNIRDYDLQPLLFIVTQVINGVAYLFPGPRYMPLRVKCIQWLNSLSSSSGIFIPVLSLALDTLESNVGKESGRTGQHFNFSSNLKLPKLWLKSQKFQEECALSAIELLSAHFSQWSHHISFPDLATIPLIHLRRFHDTTATESLRHVVKRLIDQVEQNVEFVRRKRDDVAFSPKDLQYVESFLQLEKCNGNAPFTQYYKSVMEKATSRNLVMNKRISGLGQKKSTSRRQKNPNLAAGLSANGETDFVKRKVDHSVLGERGKKQRS